MHNIKKQKILVLSAALIIIFSWSGCTPPTAAPDKKTTIEDTNPLFKDEVLDAAVKDAIIKENLLSGGGSITPDILSKIIILNLNDLKNQGEEYRVRNLEGIEKLTGLLWLNLEGSSDIENINLISALSSLQKLELPGVNLSDISFLSDLTSLFYLNLNGNYKVTDLSPIKNLSDLYVLYLAGSGATDFSFLSNLTELEYLDLTSNHIGTPYKTGVLPDLSGLHYLYSLNLTNCYLTGLGDLSSLSKLKELILTTNQDLSITGNELPTSLEELNLSINFKLINSDFLLNLPNLSKIDLSYCINLSDISILGTDTYCSELNIVNLKGCTALTKADFTGCKKLETINVTGCKMLHNLNLSSCNVKNLRSIVELITFEDVFSGEGDSIVLIDNPVSGFGDDTAVEDDYLRCVDYMRFYDKNVITE